MASERCAEHPYHPLGDCPHSRASDECVCAGLPPVGWGDKRLDGTGVGLERGGDPPAEPCAMPACRERGAHTHPP
jgi:hypothetical protein